MITTTDIGIVLMGAHRWGKEPVIEAALACGLSVYVLIPEVERNFNYHIAKGADLVYYDADAFSFNARQFAAQLNAAHANWYVLPIDDFAMHDLLALSLFWQHAPFTTQALDTCLNKHWLRTAWNGLTHTNTQLTVVPWALWKSKHAKPNKWGDNYRRDNGPFIIKPNNYSGSVGAQKVDGKDITRAVYQTFDLLKGEHQRYPSLHFKDYVIAENFIPAVKEVTVHCISVNENHEMLCIAEKTTDHHSHIETSHLVPARLDEALTNLLHTCTLQLLNMLKVRHAFSNWEYLVQENGNIAIIEGHLRPSGDRVMQLLEAATGKNPYTHFFEKLTSQTEAGYPNPKTVAGITWLKPKKILHRITDIMQPKELPEGITLQIDLEALKQTTNWPGPVDWYQRHIWISGTAKEAKTLQQELKKVIKTIKLIGVDEKGNCTETGLLPA